jgi:hypothetical protein
MTKHEAIAIQTVLYALLRSKHLIDDIAGIASPGDQLDITLEVACRLAETSHARIKCGLNADLVRHAWRNPAVLDSYAVNAQRKAQEWSETGTISTIN